jgi:hypothetical protein
MEVKKLLLIKEGPLLYIIKRTIIYDDSNSILETRDEERELCFNLITKGLEKYRNGIWVSVGQQYAFFRGYKISDLEADTKFMKLILLSKKYNSNCHSISTFLIRLCQFMVYENYIKEDIKFQPDTDWRFKAKTNKRRYIHLTKELSCYDKITIKLLKETGSIVTPETEKFYFAYKNVVMNINSIIYNYKISVEKKEQLIRAVNYNFNDMNTLINEYKYDLNALFNFIVEYLKDFENVDYGQSFSLLRDYYEMASKMGRNVKKYPKYLKSMHDIINANYKVFKQDHDEELFSNTYINIRDLEYSNNEFCIILPETTKDIISEGTSLNHCVSCYVDRIIEGKCLIIFLRKVSSAKDSLITLEYDFNNKRIVQARGSYNRNLEENELQFLKHFCELKNIVLAI